MKNLNWLKKYQVISLVVVTILLGMADITLAEDKTYLVVVNANNPFSREESFMRNVVKRVYLKQKSSWVSSLKAVTYARPLESASHKAFIREVLGMSQSELDTHWLRLKQTTGEARPREVASGRNVLRQIANNQGAFSVIEEGETRRLNDQVRVLFRFSSSN